MSIFLLLYQECFVDDIMSHGHDIKEEQFLDVEHPQQEHEEFKVEIEETKVTSIYDDRDTRSVSAEFSGLLNNVVILCE